MLDTETKRRIDTARDILVGKVPDPKSQVEQITIALIYKFMDDMDKEVEELGGKPTFFKGEFSKYSWSRIFDPRISGHELITLYSEAIDKMNHNPNIPQLFRDIFKNAYLPYRDPETLKSFLKIINEFHYSHSEKLGDAYEYLLSVLSSQGDAGQFRTPRHIIDFIVEVVNPLKTDKILDPACGTAGFLISSYKHILKCNTKKSIGDKLTPEDKKKLISNLTGYDISPDMVRISLVNMYLHGFSNPKIYEYDTLTSEDRWNEYYDTILANPPFMSPKGGIRPHKRFSIQANRSEVLFVDYIAEHLTPSGKAGIIVPEGIIFQSGNAYKNLRKMLVENYLWAVVSLPAGIFNPYSGVKTSILLMNKAIAKNSDKILFVKIENDGFDLGAQRREIGKNDLPDAKNVLMDFELGTFEEKKNKNPNYLLVSKEKIAANGDYNLSIDRYRENENLQKSNFKIVKLGDVAEVISGQSPESEFYNENKNGLPFFQGKTEFGDIYLGEPKFWTTKTTKIALKDDILMSVRAPVGTVNISTQKICIGRGLAAIRPTEKILRYFLFIYLKSIEKNIKGSGGAVFDSINRNQIMDLQIPLPPLEIQQEIVSKIESYQRIIDGAKQVVESYKPQIDINPDWKMVELGEVCEIVSGFSFDSKDFSNNNKIKSIKITNVGVGQFVETEEDLLPNDYLNKYKKYSTQKDDIVIALTRSIIGEGLKVSLVPESYKGALVNQRVALIKCDLKKVNNHYIFIQLKSERTYDFIKDKARSLMQPNLSVKDLCSFTIPLPPLEIQNQIAERIEQELKLIDANKELIKLYEQKIKTEINKVWEK